MVNSGLEVLFEGRNFIRLLAGLWTSLRIALAAFGLSAVFGLPFGLLLASKHRVVKFILRAYLRFIWIMPQLVLLFVAYFYASSALGLNLSGQAAAVIVFTAWGAAELSDLVRGAVTSVPRHQYESAQALGLTANQVQRLVVLPQSARRLLPQAVNLVTRMIKTTSLIVLIGVVEVLKVAQQIIDANRFSHPDAALWVYGTVFVLYFAACYPISRLAKHLEKKWPN
ncbi:MAG: amino acid ABC transporter permease [Propionibacteriaceae bacterium]|jgi:polar amino acid transport system permease protein|nr:amino acid ABC transporter permease [Propionibacteriaceae bacterium]